jgi:hypothetical protein
MPPSRNADESELLNRAPESDRFITGNGFASQCSLILNYGPTRFNPAGRDGWWFCKRDRVDELFAEHPPDSEIVLITHNSDYSVDRDIGRYLDSYPIRVVFSTNLELDDGRLRAIPVGIANPHWRHGDSKTLLKVQASQPPKARLFDVSFSVETNAGERAYCIEQTGLRPDHSRPFAVYLRHLANAYFCISPRGNGIDCHRTWEALYLRTIPVVTRSLLTDQHPDLPIVVLDDWSEFRSIDFSPELYERTIGAWSSDVLSLGGYLARLDAYLAARGLSQSR